MDRFSALQRAEIAEMRPTYTPSCTRWSFSALQRAEIAEISYCLRKRGETVRVSVLFNEPKLLKCASRSANTLVCPVSVLFNEPKLLKLRAVWLTVARDDDCFSALQRAEIAEINSRPTRSAGSDAFQCSSTSRNC